MKTRLIKLALFLLLIADAKQDYGQTVTYNSPNSSFDGSRIEDMVKMDYKLIYTRGADLSGGIIGQVRSGGSIKLEVFQYQPSKFYGIGDLVYSKTTNSSTTTYGGLAELVEVKGTRFGEYLKIESDDIKMMGQKSKIYSNLGGKPVCLPETATLISAVMNDGLSKESPECKTLERNQPVIIKVTQVNATAISVKIPGIGIVTIPNKNHRAFASYAGSTGAVTVCAHRGLWENNRNPENTPRAIRAALAANVDMIELDMSFTNDGVPVVFHDQGLTKRTSKEGGLKTYSFSEVKGLPIRNRFDEIMGIGADQDGLTSFEDILNILQNDPKKTFLNLDRSTNDMETFKKIYKVVYDKGMTDRCIFKGKFDPVKDSPDDTTKPTVAGFRKAFAEMFPNLPVHERETLIADMYFTPILFDNNGNYTEAEATSCYNYMNKFIQAGFADGFELIFKAYPNDIKEPNYVTNDNSKILLLRKWSILGNKNFVEWVHSFYLPVGLFASEPEFGAVPNYLGRPENRDLNDLRSGFEKEDYEKNYVPYIKDQPLFDFRGDPGFYIRAGADYVITDRPEHLTVYLRAISRSTH